MIKQILKQIWVERRVNTWLVLELFGIFICLFVVTDFFFVKWSTYSKPTGHDVENVYLFNTKLLATNSPNYVDAELITETQAEEILRLMEQIRMHPDVEAVSSSFYATPYTRGGYYNTLKTDTLSANTQVRSVTSEYFNVFRIKNYKGEPIRIGQGAGRQIVLAKKTAEQLFSSADNAIGKLVYGGEDTYLSKEEARPALVIDVSQNFKAQEFDRYRESFFEIMDPVSLNAYISEEDVRDADICVRVYAGKAKHFEEKFKEDMGERLRVNNLYIASITSFDQLRNQVIGKTIRESINIMIYVTMFALITVFIGIFGAFWLRSRQRNSEIGIRMAMGAGKSAIRRAMITESLCLMTIALLPASIIYVNLLYTEVLDIYYLPFTLDRVLIVSFIAIVTMTAVVAAGTLWPANRAASVQPVEALRDE